MGTEKLEKKEKIGAGTYSSGEQVDPKKEKRKRGQRNKRVGEKALSPPMRRELSETQPWS